MNPYPPNENISAVVLCYNAERHIRNCVESLAAAFAVTHGTHEIWVVDNGSTDRSASILDEMAIRHSSLLHIIRERRNTGTTRSRNRAICASTGGYILIMDADATICSATVESLVDRLKSDPSIGLAAPRLQYPDGRYQLSTDEFPTIGRKLERLIRLRDIENRYTPPTSAGVVDCVISAVWMIPRRVFQHVGPLDERIFYSPEDIDYCVRIWLAGYRIVFFPDLIAVHDAQELSKNIRSWKFFIRHSLGLLYFFLKHRYCISNRRIYSLISQAHYVSTKKSADGEKPSG